MNICAKWMHPNVMHLDEQIDEFSFTVDKA